MHFSQKQKVSQKLIIQAIGLTILIRLALLVIQRSIGINWDFHPDALYYTQHIANIRTNGLDALLSDRGLENAFFIIIGYIATTLVFGVIDDSTTLIILNIIVACLTTHKILTITSSTNIGRLPIPVIFFILSPYLAHISIHPLKDTLTIYLTVSLLSQVIERRIGFAILAAALLILTRSYLGALTSITLSIWWILRNKNTTKSKTLVVFCLYSVLFFFAVKQQLVDRIEVEFDGRDFYSNGFLLVPSNPELRFFLGWLFNFLVPFPYLPRSAGEAGYFLHWLLFTLLTLAGIRKIFKEISNQAFGLLIASLFLFSFILVTTPSAGPLVRYRLSSEILLLISLQGLRNSAKGNSSPPRIVQSKIR